MLYFKGGSVLNIKKDGTLYRALYQEKPRVDDDPLGNIKKDGTLYRALYQEKPRVDDDPLGNTERLRAPITR